MRETEMAKRVNDEIEIGDLVKVVAGPDSHWIGMVGVLDNFWQGKFVVMDPAPGGPLPPL